MVGAHALLRPLREDDDFESAFDEEEEGVADFLPVSAFLTQSNKCISEGRNGNRQLEARKRAINAM